MKCYKCHTAAELSIKTRRRDGSVCLMICRSCRRLSKRAELEKKGSYVLYLERQELRRIRWMIEWDIKAWKINTQIMRKYA